jgi:hypothetical protein
VLTAGLLLPARRRRGAGPAAHATSTLPGTSCSRLARGSSRRSSRPPPRSPHARSATIASSARRTHIEVRDSRRRPLGATPPESAARTRPHEAGSAHR